LVASGVGLAVKKQPQQSQQAEMNQAGEENTQTDAEAPGEGASVRDSQMMKGIFHGDEQELVYSI
jgi:hypothetical protein